MDLSAKHNDSRGAVMETYYPVRARELEVGDRVHVGVIADIDRRPPGLCVIRVGDTYTDVMGPDDEMPVCVTEQLRSEFGSTYDTNREVTL